MPLVPESARKHLPDSVVAPHCGGPWTEERYLWRSTQQERSGRVRLRTGTPVRSEQPTCGRLYQYLVYAVYRLQEGILHPVPAPLRRFPTPAICRAASPTSHWSAQWRGESWRPNPGDCNLRNCSQGLSLYDSTRGDYPSTPTDRNRRICPDVSRRFTSAPARRYLTDDDPDCLAVPHIGGRPPGLRNEPIEQRRRPPGEKVETLLQVDAEPLSSRNSGPIPCQTSCWPRGSPSSNDGRKRDSRELPHCLSQLLPESTTSFVLMLATFSQSMSRSVFKHDLEVYHIFYILSSS